MIIYFNKHTKTDQYKITNTIEDAFKHLRKRNVDGYFNILQFDTESDKVIEYHINKRTLNIDSAVESIEEPSSPGEYLKCKIFNNSIFVNYKENIISRDFTKVIRESKKFPIEIEIIRYGNFDRPDHFSYIPYQEIIAIANSRIVTLYDSKFIIDIEEIELKEKQGANRICVYDYGIIFDGIKIPPWSKIVYDGSEYHLSYSMYCHDKNMTFEEAISYKGIDSIDKCLYVINDDGYDIGIIPARMAQTMLV